MKESAAVDLALAILYMSQRPFGADELRTQRHDGLVALCVVYPSLVVPALSRSFEVMHQSVLFIDIM